MGWGTERFFAAFAKAGMLVSGTCVVGAHAGDASIDFDLRHDSALSADLQMSAASPYAEYETASAADLSAGDVWTIGGRTFRVVNAPREMGDGKYSQIDLQENIRGSDY